MDEQSSFVEVYQRLGSVEQGLAIHVASCTEHRKNEEERHQTAVKKMESVSAELKAIETKVQEVNRNFSELKGKFAIVIAGITTAGAVVGNVIPDIVKAFLEMAKS